LILGPEEVMGGVKEQPAESGAVAALSVTGNFLFDAADHRDFLGAILGTGV
jgi:RNA-binding protein YlmH